MSSAVAGLKAHQDAIDVVGNNIANVNTHSFKSGSVSFRDVMYQNIVSAAGGDPDTGLAGTNPSQIGYGAATASVGVDTSNGGKDQTGRPNDCYIDGQGYFVVADGGQDGTNNYPVGMKYTRVGSLQFDSQGYLTDGNGNYVLGVNNDAGEDGAIPTVTTAMDGKLATDGSLKTDQGDMVPPEYIHYSTEDNTLSNVSFGSDGTITATSGGEVVTLGKVALAHFSNAAGLEDIGSSYYKDTTNSGAAEFYVPGSGATGNLVTGSLENSNVDLATEFSNMILYERGYQANTKIISVADEMLQTLVNMK
jgi:flagellar hook protein FlgE